VLTFDDLVAGFDQVGLKEGDTLMLHSSYKSLGGVHGGAEVVIDALRESVGEGGTVLFPTFNFQSWTETHYFDRSETPSNMGILTELARRRAEAIRTPHPIYSFAVLGSRQREFADCNDVEAYGEQSAFGLFHRLNGMILSIGLHFNSTFSMHHYVEFHTGCEYRRQKSFSGIYVDSDGVPQIRSYSMFVRASPRILTDIVPGMTELVDAGVIHEGKVGEATIHFCRATSFFDNMAVIVREHPEKLHRAPDPGQ
jgi:aminoglycoside N3'-acetyltransferase